MRLRHEWIQEIKEELASGLRLTLEARKLLDHSKLQGKKYRVVDDCGDSLIVEEIADTSNRYKVNTPEVGRWGCECWIWGQTGVPCKHGAKALLHRGWFKDHSKLYARHFAPCVQLQVILDALEGIPALDIPASVDDIETCNECDLLEPEKVKWKNSKKMQV
jgi:hypothetical protein